MGNITFKTEVPLVKKEHVSITHNQHVWDPCFNNDNITYVTKYNGNTLKYSYPELMLKIVLKKDNKSFTKPLALFSFVNNSANSKLVFCSIYKYNIENNECSLLKYKVSFSNALEHFDILMKQFIQRYSIICENNYNYYYEDIEIKKEDFGYKYHQIKSLFQMGFTIHGGINYE